MCLSGCSRQFDQVSFWTKDDFFVFIPKGLLKGLGRGGLAAIVVTSSPPLEFS
jgi:hypothetical protein